jgi:Tfp pilus assembly protein PilF
MKSFTRLFYLGNRLIGIIFLLVAACFFINFLSHLKVIDAEKKAFKLQITGYNSEAKNEYKKLLSSNHNHGYNYYSYAELLYFSKRLTEAEKVLNSGLRYYTEHKVYRLKAVIEKELGKFTHAEKSFLKALYMVPNRMESRFNLMNFYIEVKDTIKARYWAYSILKMPVKIRSYRTEVMIKATKKLLGGL